MKKKIIFMFAGQGAHYYQMGKILFEKNPVFRQWMIAGDKLYQALTHHSLLETIYHPTYTKGHLFSQTLLTHPAILLIEHALGQVLLSNNIIPDAVLGVSLGEFCAAVFAGVMSFETAMQTVVKQAQLFESLCSPGSMLAILNDNNIYHSQYILSSQSELASINYSSHFVISGETTAIQSIATHLKQQNILCQELAVSQAFHSSHLDIAGPTFLNFIRGQTIHAPTLPFISCVYPQQDLRFVPASHFWNVARQPIQFMATIQHLEKMNHYDYIDVGPSGTLATFVKYNLAPSSSSQSKTLMTPMKNDLEILDKCLMAYKNTSRSI